MNKALAFLSLYVALSGPAYAANTALPASGSSAIVNHVTQVACSDSIATAITNASAGDTLVLGSCTYSVSSAITVSKSINIIGQGESSTIISATLATNTDLFTITAAPFGIQKLSIIGTGVRTAINIDASSGTAFDYNQVLISHVRISTSNNNGSTIDGIFLLDSGGIIKDSSIKTSLDNPSISTAQAKTIHFKHQSTQEKALQLYVLNTHNECSITNDSFGSTVTKCIMNWNNAADQSLSTSTMYFENSYSKAATSNGAISYGMLNEGPNTVSYLVDSVLDGGTGSASGNNLDLLASGNSLTGNIVYTYNTVFVEGRTSANGGGSIVGLGQFIGGSVKLLGNATPDNLSVTPGADAEDLVNAAGGTGGATSISTTGTGGAGADSVVTLGTGGVANSANTGSTGGRGGSFTHTGGTGGAATVATGTNTGGAGGSHGYYGGNGGNASGGTSNTGGPGGSIYAAGGNGGTGSTANGAAGNVFLAVTKSGTQIGGVKVGSTVAPTSLFELAAGSSSKSQSRFDKQTEVSSPNDGDLFYSSTGNVLRGFFSGMKQALSGTIFSQTTTINITNTTAETTITAAGQGSLVLPANFFFSGKTIRVTAAGDYSTAGSAHTLTINLKLGSTVVATTGAITMPITITQKGWRIDAQFCQRSTGATGQSYTYGNFYYDDGTTMKGAFIKDPTNGFVSVDTTGSLTVDITATWGTASPSDKFRTFLLTAEVLS